MLGSQTCTVGHRRAPEQTTHRTLPNVLKGGGFTCPSEYKPANRKPSGGLKA